jgi:hypothetical protein
LRFQPESLKVVSSQITHQYGFQLTEDEMFQRIFKYQPMMKNKQNYAQLECLECLKLTNKMLEDEMKAVLAYYSRFKKQFTDPKRKIIDLTYD